MSTSVPFIELRAVSKRYPGTRREADIIVLSEFNLSICRRDDTEFVVILGPSGCGKTTILGLMSGSVQPDEGEVLLAGRTMHRPSRISATVPQAYTCFPWLTVAENVEFGLAIRQAKRSERRCIALEYLEKVGLADRRSSYPQELSGGMQQRVALARALAVRPQVIFMDEPFGALDAQTRTEMQEMLLRTAHNERTLVIFVTHDISEALLLADRIIALSARPARIIRDFRVPFERPRRSSLVHDGEFVRITEELVHVLGRSPEG